MAKKAKTPEGLWKRGQTYYSRIQFRGNRIIKRLSTNLEDAKRMLADLRHRYYRDDYGITDNNFPWSDLKKEFLAWAKQALRPAVSAEYERDLRDFELFANPQTVRDITHGVAVSFREQQLAAGGKARVKRRRRGQPVLPPQRIPLSPATVNRKIGTVINMLNRGVKSGRIGSNPLDGFSPLRNDRPKKARRALSSDEVEALFAASPDYLRPVWRMFMVTGIRKDELVNLKFSDIDFETRTMIVRTWIAKTHQEREIDIEDDMFETIVKLRDEAKRRRPIPGSTPDRTRRQAENFSKEHVFVTQANTPLANNLLARFYACCKRANIEGAHSGGSVDIHSLRVSFTTISISNGANPGDVQAILGHKTMRMTMGIYNKATRRGKRRAIAALPFAKLSQPSGHIVSIEMNPARGEIMTEVAASDPKLSVTA